MANFTTHVSTSTAIGLAYGGAAYAWFDVPLSTSILAGGLCSVSGMLPDLDSNSGKPLRESVAFAAAVVPMMLVDRMRQFGFASELMVLGGAGVYLLIRFGLGWLLKKFTVHRGMFHSLPAAAIFFEVAFLLTSGEDVRLRWYKAGGVLVGYLTHLVLDELYSLEWYRGRWRFKKSFGTAVKLFGDGLGPNALSYGLLGLLSFVVFFEPGWMEQVHTRYAEAQARFWQYQHARLEAARQAESAPGQAGNPGPAPTGETGAGEPPILIPRTARDVSDPRPLEPTPDGEPTFRFLR